MRVSPGLAVCLAGSAGVLLSVCAACRHEARNDSQERTELIRAFGPARLVEGRLAGVPFAPLSRGGPWPEPRDEEAWTRTANEVEERLQVHRSPATLANQALVKLALREPLQQVAELLEQAVALPRPRARVWSDLAAVRLAQAESEGDPHRLVMGLAAADRALQLDSRLPEALFNRVKIAERLSLRSLAREDWRRYLDLDASSGWAQEARASQASLGSPSVVEEWTKARPLLEQAVAAGDEATLSALAGKFPHGTRGYLEGTVFRAWAKAVEEGDRAQAAHWVRTARVLASRLLDLTGDRLDAEAVSAIEGVPPALALDLARAHREYAEGARLYGFPNYTLARPHFAVALEGFNRARSPFSLAARSELAACDYQTGQWKQGMAAAGEILESARSRGYRSLVGHNAWLIGLAQLEAAQADLARTPFEKALEAFQAIHDGGSEAWIDSLLANCLGQLQQNDEAWRERLKALATAARTGDPWALTTVFSAAARAVLKDGRTTEAILFQNEILNLAESSGDLQRIAEAHWGQAKIYHRAGDAVKAQELIAKAEAEASRIPDQRAADPTRASIAATAGEIWLDTNPQRAKDSLTRALRLYGDNAYSRTAILRLRASARRGQGHDRDAEADLFTAVGEHEKQRESIRPGLRADYFETARQVFEDLVALELHLGHDDRAFDYAERAKARALLDSLAARHLTPAKPLLTAEVDRGLPPGTALIEYAVLSDRVVAWVRGAGRAESAVAHSIDWQKADLEAAVADLAQTIAVPSGDRAADTERFERLSALLFFRLIAPFLGQVPVGATLVVVPDGALREVPFAALLKRRGHRFLVERNPLVVASSATTFLARSARRPEESRPRDRWQTLAVGGATIDVARYPEHGPLPQTEHEAREVERAHPGSLLVEGDATVPSFLAALDRFDLIHVAGHAGVDQSKPPRPALLFAPAPGGYETGALGIDAIAAQRLTRPRLAVLAACGAAGGSGLSLEGGADLARSFVEAGVPAVVGNLWSLDDKDASVFLEAFYRSFWKGQSATSALREAQLEMIHHPDASFQRPAVWGGFRLLGTAAGQNLP